MTVQALGYIGVRAKSLEDWAGYGVNFLGRHGRRKQRLVVDADGGQGIGFFGWEMADAAALDDIAARLERWAPRSRAAPARLPTSGM